MHMDQFYFESPLGTIVLKGDCEGLQELYFTDQITRKDNTVPGSLQEAVIWLQEYFDGKKPEWIPLLNIQGSPFLKSVLEITREIPYGMTSSYGELARKLQEKTGRRSSARAIGQAMHRNPVCLIVPCHRVIFSDGSLGGYAHGTEIKRALLSLEGQQDFGN